MKQNCLNTNTVLRVKKLIQNIIEKLQINLTGETVLTEAGSHFFMFTPIIAAMAGAKTIFIWSRDSSFGDAKDIQNQFDEVLKFFDLKDTKFLWALNDRPKEHIQQATIITNLGFVRPLNKAFLSHIDPHKTVISLMFEAWEIRESDIDIEFCRKQNIRVSGTWESHPNIRIFEGCGPLAIKMSHEAGYEVFQNNIIVWSDDSFGKIIESAFLRYGASHVIRTTTLDTLLENIDSIDFIFICDYDEKRTLVGKSGVLNLNIIKEKNPGIGIVHLYGKVDAGYIQDTGLNVYPNKNGKEMNMSFTLAHIGPILMINLHAAGLKVAQSTLRSEKSDLVQPISN